MSLKDNIKKNIRVTEEVATTANNNTVSTTATQTETPKLVITKKSDSKKIVRKKYQMEMDPEMYKELERLKKMTGRSIVELTNMLVRFGLDNLEIK